MAVVYSFDVFDTVLVRRVADPTDILRLVAQAIERTDSATDLNDFEDDFISARIAAEQIARAKAHPREDCTLDEIWHELRTLMPGLPAAASAALELQVDRDNLVANPDIAGHIAALQDAGERVVFISDIYYSREALYSLLAGAGLARDIGQVYASGEEGTLKATGRLFAHVAQTEGTPTAALMHTGDNLVSDVKMAKAQGVRASLYQATRLNEAERAIIAAFRHNLAGSRLAAAMRLTRLSGHAQGRAGLVSAYLGPMAVLQAAWALRQAAERKAARVYFVARDGYAPWRAANAIGTAFPEVESRYIKLSRQALVAAMPQLGEFGVFWIERSWAGLTLSQIASLVGHDWSDVAIQASQAIPHAAGDYLLQTKDEMHRFIEVLDAASARAGTNNRKASSHDAAHEYLRRNGLFDSQPFLLFDVGWYLTNQAALKTVLDERGATGFLGGLYLGLRIGRVDESVAGPARAIVYEKPYSPDLPQGSNTIFDRMILIEHLMGLAPHGSAKGYLAGEDSGAPTVSESPITPERRLVVERISDEVAAFAELVAPFARDMGREDETRQAIESLTNHFLAAPGAYDLSLLDELEVESDSGSVARMRVTEEWRVSTALLQAAPYRARERFGLSHGPSLWTEASLANSSALSRGTLSAIRMLKGLGARALRLR